MTILNNSFIAFPRKYLFTQIRNTNNVMNSREYGRHLKGIYKDKNLSISILRASYISWFYKNNVDILSREQLAKQMRHSRHTAELLYCKIDTNACITNTDVNTTVKIVKNNGHTFDIKTWSRNYQKENKDKFNNASKKYYHDNKFVISRKKVLKHLNKKSSAIPRKKSLQIYGLKFNETRKFWY